jgi:hypothetical protein
MPSMVRFTVNGAERKSLDSVIKRASALGLFSAKPGSAEFYEAKRSSLMDFRATHANGCSLDFEKLLSFDDFSFLHDWHGIAKHLDRRTGRLQNCFVPRCAK